MYYACIFYFACFLACTLFSHWISCCYWLIRCKACKVEAIDRDRRERKLGLDFLPISARKNAPHASRESHVASGPSKWDSIIRRYGIWVWNSLIWIKKHDQQSVVRNRRHINWSKWLKRKFAGCILKSLTAQGRASRRLPWYVRLWFVKIVGDILPSSSLD